MGVSTSKFIPVVKSRQRDAMLPTPSLLRFPSLGYRLNCLNPVFLPNRHYLCFHLNRSIYLSFSGALQKISPTSGDYYLMGRGKESHSLGTYIKKVIVTKNTVSCSSRCFGGSRRLMSFLESSEQISRFGAACKKTASEETVFGAPTGTRTRDPLIKSQLLYQLSYWCSYNFVIARGLL